MSSSAIKFLSGICLFILAGFIGYHLLPDTKGFEQNKETLSKAIEAVIDKPIKAVPIAPEETLTEPIESDSDVETLSEIEGITPPKLRYLRWTTEEQNGALRACLIFDSSFSAAKESDLKPFFNISPEIPFSVDSQQKRICLLGLNYGQTYSVDVKKGLSADNGAELMRKRRIAVAFEDKPAFVGFAGDGIILPDTKGARVVLKTVNVDRLSLTLYRVNDRILSQHSPDLGDSGTAQDYVSTYAATGRRVEIWSDDIEIPSDRNNIVETTFDLQDKIQNKGPGAYILIAKHMAEGQSSYRQAKAFRWLISTDLALTSYRGSDALHVAVRSIKESRLKAGVRLDLIAVNNEQLTEVMTDSQGRAVFDNAILSGEGPLKPRMIMAYGPDGDYAVLDLSRAPLDLSMMDVQGRQVSGPLDLYAFTDRGIYRPGQTVHLTTLLRDRDARAITGRALKLTLVRPDKAVEQVRTLMDEETGGYVTSITLPQQAARGIWSLKIKVEGTKTHIIEKISVEDFVPQRLGLTISPDEHSVLNAGEDRDVSLNAQFYYGAPGSHLETEGELRIQRDPKPFPEFKDYSFGDVTEDFRERLVSLHSPMTNEEGQAKLKLRLTDTEAKSSYPLRGSLIAGVAEPGGRYVRENTFIPIRALDNYIGYKSRFGDRATRRKPAEIELIALNRSGQRKTTKLKWTLKREQRDYSWYRHRNRWQYRNRTKDVFMNEGEMSISSDVPTIWAKSLDWGRYRLDVETKAGEISSFRFGVGWSNWGASDSDSPDRILVGATDLPTKPGGNVTLNLKAPYAGRGDIVIADHTVRSIRTIDIPEGASSVRIPYDPSWGHDVYAMVTLYTPLDAEKRKGVKRAVGLTHIALDRAEQTLKVAINTPARVKPRTTLDIPIELTGNGNRKAWVSVAAVDEGILALTDFTSPDAPDAFFKKKAFTLDIRDDYSRILNPYLANGPTRSGGDGIGGAGLSVVPTKTVALFEGLVQSKNGKATVSFDLPDFNGELRIMATAWSETAIGSASSSIKVRDAVPINLALPRFLAPGDTAVATLSVDNIDGASGLYSIKTDAEGLMEEVQQAGFDLTPGTRDQTGINLTSSDLGVFELKTSAKGPKGYSVNSVYPIEVRSPFRPITRRVLEVLEPGESYTIQTNILDGYSVAGADIDLSVARLPGLSAAPYIAALNRYPYGCTEQTVSKAMPLLFVSKLGGFNDTSQTELNTRIDDAIERVTARQSGTGEFGLWSRGDGYLAPWLQLYVSEFLIQANRNGYGVSDQSLQSAIIAAQSLSRMEEYSQLKLTFPNSGTRKAVELQRAERAAYAHYIVALADKPDASGIRYLDKAFGDKIESSLAQTYLGAALARIGDQDRANVAFKRAYDRLGKGEGRRYRYYSSSERDAAALLAIGAEALEDEIVEKILLGLTDLDPATTSTQERSYIIRAIANLDTDKGDINITSKGVKLTQNSASILGTDLRRKPSFHNKGQTRAYLTVDMTSTPTKSPDPIKSGFEISKSLYSITGDPISTISAKRGERYVVLVEAEAKFRSDSMIVIADLLPAGLEIETILNPDDAGEEGAFSFLGELSEFDMQEARDDRYIASDRRTRWNREGKSFRAAYIVRAVTVGEFTFPGAIIEDMYRPARVGTTETTLLQIKPAGAL